MGAPTPEFVANIFRSMAPGHGQDSSSQASTPANSIPLFTSFPMNSSVPADFANIHVNMDSATRENSGNMGESSEPGVRIDANANLNFDGGLEQVSDALRSVVGMLSSQFAPHADTPGGWLLYLCYRICYTLLTYVGCYGRLFPLPTFVHILCMCRSNTWKPSVKQAVRLNAFDGSPEVCP
ncbi:hypothetical protein GW17_00008826 [Ensete ventricosum]|nr:hypothetical protein GW17_00008826 [Ensete ventricosum]